MLVLLFERVTLYKRILQLSLRCTQLYTCTPLHRWVIFSCNGLYPTLQIFLRNDHHGLPLSLYSRADRLWPILEKVSGRVAHAFSYGNSHPSLAPHHHEKSLNKPRKRKRYVYLSIERYIGSFYKSFPASCYKPRRNRLIFTNNKLNKRWKDIVKDFIYVLRFL